MSKSRRPLRAVVPCFNMAARTNRTSVIRERNERGFRNFLQNLKAVFHLFLTPGNEQLTTDALRNARRYLLDAKGTLSRDTRRKLRKPRSFLSRISLVRFVLAAMLKHGTTARKGLRDLLINSCRGIINSWLAKNN